MLFPALSLRLEGPLAVPAWLTEVRHLSPTCSATCYHHLAIGQSYRASQQITVNAGLNWFCTLADRASGLIFTTQARFPPMPVLRAEAVPSDGRFSQPQQEDEVSDVVIQAVFGDHISPEQVKAGIKFNPLYSENADSNAARTHYGTYNYLDVHHLRSLHTKEAAPEFHSPESHHIGTNGDVIVPNGSEKPAFVQLDAALRKSENGPRKNGILANGPAGKQKANGCVKWAPLPQLVKSASLQKSNNARTQDKNDNKEKKASSRLYDTTDAIMHGYDTLIWKTLEKKKRRYVLRAFLCVLGILILLGLFVMAVVLPLYFFNFLGG
ncbi:uncharacterized protein LOC144920629 isoform X1 [Branchiostoma floridae x Branchiostoma belcheri]